MRMTSPADDPVSSLCGVYRNVSSDTSGAKYKYLCVNASLMGKILHPQTRNTNIFTFSSLQAGDYNGL